MTGNDAAETLHERLVRAEKNTRAILNGEKPLLDPAMSADRLFQSLLDDMAATRDLDSPAIFYYVTPGDLATGYAAEKKKVNTEVHPLHADLVAAEGRLMTALADRNIRNAQLLGADFFSEKRANNFILPARGALPALAQALDVLTCPNSAPKTLTVDNSTGRWTPLLAMLGLGTPEQILAFNSRGQGLHLAVAQSEAEIGDIIAAHGHEPVKAIAPARTLFEPSQKPYLAFDTTNVIKLTDAIKTIKRGGQNVYMADGNSVGGHSETSLEFTKSYGGNALDKLISTLRYKAALPPGVVESDLAAHGATLDNAYLVVCDAGADLAPEMIAQPEFDGIRDLLIPGVPAPGPEMKSVIDRMGTTTDFYEAALKARKNLPASADASSITDNYVWLIAPLKQADPAHPVYYAVRAHAVNQLSEARPKSEFNRIDKHYMTPPGGDKTFAELAAENNPAVWHDTALARSLTALLQKSGAKQRAPSLKQEFNVAAGFHVLANHQLKPGVSERELQALDQALHEKGMSLAEDVQPPRTLSDIRDLIRKNDGYVIMPGSRDFDFYLNGLLQTSLLTGKQLHDPHVDPKHIEYLRSDPEDRSTITRIIDHTKAVGMVGTHYDQFFRNHADLNGLAQSFAKSARSYKPLPEETPKPKIALPGPAHPPVAIFHSASTAIPEYLDDAYDLAANLVRNGFTVVGGMGRQSMMGLLVYAALAMRAQGADAEVMGVQDPYAMITEGWPKEFVDQLETPDHAQVAGDIFERIETIAHLSDIRATGQPYAHTIQAGGIGTLQEFFALAWLKMNDPQLANLHLILENAPREMPDGTMAGPYDELLRHIPKEDYARLNLHVCTSVEEDMACRAAIYGRPMAYHREKNPVGFYPFDKNPHIGDLQRKPDQGPALLQ
jgi:predicted Rossmann-fold nucleotide-binding protein